MQKFIRKNIVLFTATFAAEDGTSAQPANAEVVLTYTNTSNVVASSTIAMTVANNIWTATWDSSQALSGYVDWMAHCWNGLVAAAEGQFLIVVNRSNIG